MSELADRHCSPSTRRTPRLTYAHVEALLAQVPEWTVIDGRRIEREYRLPDFASALDLVNRIGAIAEAEDHHPDIALSWGRVGVVLWTHVIDGLSENDFIVAAKCERAYVELESALRSADRGA